MNYPVIVENCNTRKNAMTLCIKYRLRPQQDGTLVGEIPSARYNGFRTFCAKNHIRFGIADEFGERSSDYRATYFKNNQPHFFGRYFCAYCGYPLSARKVNIDHIIPVGVANKDLRTRKIMKLLGYKSVNDPRNLVASCKRCNLSKGTKMGLWVLQGHLGKSKMLWYIRHSIRIAFIIWLISFFVR